jgi:rhomboid family GlyGly-CTERM serine protease
MNIVELQSPAASSSLFGMRTFLRRCIGNRTELVFFTIFIAIFSGPALFGIVWQDMMFHPSAVRAGEWWRLVTHPFVHITWYHLLLDASAFLLLYHGLIESSRARRLLYVIGSGVGSLAFAWIASPMIFTVGLCGLSGMAHGLMAVSAVEMMTGRRHDSAEWRIGAATLLVVVAKAAYEAVTGKILFAFLYFGMVGDPVTASHAGGIIGALTVMFLFSVLRRHKTHHAS